VHATKIAANRISTTIVGRYRVAERIRIG
jgi:hypothetical protein